MLVFLTGKVVLFCGPISSPFSSETGSPFILPRLVANASTHVSDPPTSVSQVLEPLGICDPSRELIARIKSIQPVLEKMLFWPSLTYFKCSKSVALKLWVETP